MQRRNIPTWLPFIILAAAIVIIFWRLLLGEVFYWGLPSLQYYPWRQFAFNEMRLGHLPFWNPYSGGGTPLIANYQSAILYPPNWLHLISSDGQAMGFLAVLHVVWAGIGMWLFTKTLGLARMGRAISMLSFSLSTYLLGQTPSLAFISTLAWLPWLFWATTNVLNSRQLRFAGLLGVFAGLQLLAGHLQVSWYSYIGVGMYALWYIIFVLRPLGRRDQLSGLLLVIFGLGLGAGIASTQLILTLEFLFQSHRAGGVDFETLTAESFAPWEFLKVFAPKLFGVPGDGTYNLEPRSDAFFVIMPYIGILPLLSAYLAVLGWLKKRNLLTRLETFQSVPFWLVLTAVGVILAMGRYTFIYPILYDHVPTFNGFRGPERWLMLPVFSLSLLAGIGVHDWQLNPQSQQRFRVVITFLFSVLSITILAMLATEIETQVVRPLAIGVVTLIVLLILAINVVTRMPSNPANHLRWQVIVMLFIVVDLTWAISGLIPTVPRSFYNRDLSVSSTQGRLFWYEDYQEQVRNRRYFDLTDYRRAQDRWADIRTSLLPNLNVVDRIPSFNNFDALQPANHRRYVELIEGSDSNLHNLLEGAGIGEVYGADRPHDWEGNNRQYVAPVVPETVWLVQNVRFVETKENVEDILRSPAWNPKNTVIISNDVDFDGQAFPHYQDATLEVVYERPNERRYRVQADGGGYLVMANTWYPGWSARIEGESATIYRANLAFQAVEFPAGDVTITLEYRPRGLELGLLLTLASIFGAVAIIAVDLFLTSPLS
jgi:hypothetical protein